MLHKKGLLRLCIMMFLLYGLFAAVCSQGVYILRQHESAEKTVQLKLMGDRQHNVSNLLESEMYAFASGEFFCS